MKKKFTDIFIKRPVLATVISLLIFLVGLRSLDYLQVRQFPEMKNTVITINTVYPGASSEVVQGFVTTPLEKSVASADGIDYLVSSSTDGMSTIKAYIKLNFSPETAFTNIMAKVAEAKGDLPRASQQPVIEKDTGATIALMYLSFNSNQMTPQQITDYVSRVVQPKVESVQGVAQAQILGGSTYAMRIWLNTEKMTALGVTPADVAAALQKNNYQSTAGKTKGEYVAYSVDMHTDIRDPSQFQQVVVKNNGGSLVRLNDVARIELGSEDYDSSVSFNGQQAVFMGIMATPTANPLTVISDVRKILPNLESSFPPSLTLSVAHDSTTYIRSSIREVLETIVEATLIVIAVIFLFLGSLRTVIIPILAIPLSLVGVMSLMFALGYSINLLTLLALVLAIGMVVDDAIVVVENIYRHIEAGMLPKQAALQGAREIATPVITMTITLAAVYAPIGFMSGLTGALFKEFAFTLAATVIVSGVVALTLSPMLCSKLLSADIGKQRFVHLIDAFFGRLKTVYQKALHATLAVRPAVYLFSSVIFLLTVVLWMFTPNELAPDEDQSAIFISSTAPQYANINYTEKFSNELNAIFKSIPETNDYFTINGAGDVNNVISGLMLKPWNERKRSQQAVLMQVNQDISNIAGLQSVAFGLPSLPSGEMGALPVQFVLTSTGDYKTLANVMEKIKADADKSGQFIFTDYDLKFNKPELSFTVDRDKAAELGVSMQDIADSIAAALGGNYINLFSMQGRSYKVIPQVSQDDRFNPDAIEKINIRTASGRLIPISTLVSFKQTVIPSSLPRFQQLNSATLQGMAMPPNTAGQVLNYLVKEAKKYMPQGMTYDFSGQARQFMTEGNALMLTMMFSLIVIFLVLAAQFESFRDPLIILVAFIMSAFGALTFMQWGFATLNIYTKIGLITLIGLISKHGILMVEFANQLQEEEGLSKAAAIEKACAIRLRPILMTTASMVLGVLPLLLATGAGSHGRFDIGVVIASGMTIGTLFTLFVVPSMYVLLARNRDKHATSSVNDTANNVSDNHQ